MLLVEFGSLGAVLAAPSRRLGRLLGSDSEAVAVISWFRTTMLAALKPPIGGRIAISDWSALSKYLQADLGFTGHERLRVLFLDARNRLLVDEVMAIGSSSTISVELRHILARAIEVGAAGIIMVHNHPSGDTTPSRSDVETTRRAQDLCAALGMELHDHLIVGSGNLASMRQLGLLR